MAKQDIDIGVEGNDGTGDSIRESFRKVNENFQELYAAFGVGGSISFTTLGDTPSSLVGDKVLYTVPTADGPVVGLFNLVSDTADGGANDSITIARDGENIILKTSFREVANDDKPRLGGGLHAQGYGIAGVGINQAAVNEWNSNHNFAPDRADITIDDLVITKGYADTRYVAGDRALRVGDEPTALEDTDYIITVQSYSDGNIVLADHGFTKSFDGTPYIFKAEDTDPSSLVSGTTYYLRFVNSDEISIHRTKEGALENTDKAYVTHVIDVDDIHTFTDAAYNPDLAGLWLDNQAIPRKSIVRRQGDTMTGPLILSDSPGELAGLTTSPEELQAATKFYVDNTSYTSPTNLFVSTTGDDTMRGVPAGKEGTSQSYAYRTINAAAKRAEEMIRASQIEPGPYMQTITRDGKETFAEVVGAGIDGPLFNETRTLITRNIKFLTKELSAYMKFKYPDFEYNVDLCQRDTGLILDAIAFDINKSQSGTLATANSLTRIAAERYYASASSRIAITRQLTETVDFIETLRDYVVDYILLNRPFKQVAVSGISQSAICRVTTSVAHGLEEKNIVKMTGVIGMTEVNDTFYYVKPVSVTQFEIFTDENLEQPVNSLGFGQYSSGGTVGVVFQTDDKQFADSVALPTNAFERTEVRNKFDLILEIIQDGIDAGAREVQGRTYNLEINNGGLTALDQHLDILPGKVIVGKISGAIGRIVELITQEDGSGGSYDLVRLHLLKAIDFIEGEGLEFGNFVYQKQISILVETGQYEEDYPIKVPANVTIIGDEFRRVIVRPKNRVSQSKWAKTYIYRDLEFDGIVTAKGGSRFYNQTGEWQGYFGYHYLSNPEKVQNTGISVTNIGEYLSSAAILKENKEFITEEVISYIDNNKADILYDKTQFRTDLYNIVTGITYDIVFGTNFNARYYGQRFQRSSSIYLDSELQTLWVLGLNEAKRIITGLPALVSSTTATTRANDAFAEIIDIIQNGVLDTDTSVDALSLPNPVTPLSPAAADAVVRLQNNIDFIAAEGLAYLKSIAPRKYFDDDIRLRDFKELVDGLSYDILYGGNFGSREFAKNLFVDGELRLEITTREETIDAIDRLISVMGDIITGVAVTPTDGNQELVDPSGSNATATEVSNLTTYLTIVKTQLENNNLLSLDVATFPNTISESSALNDAKNAIDGATSTIQDNAISVMDTNASLNYRRDKCRRDVGLIVDALIRDLLNGGDEYSTEVQGQYYDSYISKVSLNNFGGQENATKNAIKFIATIANRLFLGSYNPADIEQNPLDSSYVEPDFRFGVGEAQTGTIVTNLINKIVFAFDRRYNPPLRNDEMDVFLLNDATRISNMTVQGHGGFMTVLDPDGQILTKSPYIQVGSSFSKSVNKKHFAGGMFVDAYCGNLPGYVPTTIDPEGDGNPESGKTNNFEIWMRSEEGQGLFNRPPELPCPFYVEGRRFQVNAISDYDSGNGWCKLYLDKSSNDGLGYDESVFEENPGQIQRTIYLQTAGNRSILGNDFTQINDLGYALVTNNGAFSEMVSMFTYYCHAAFYAKNGSEIRSTTGSCGYGNFGLVAEGADPNEIPDQVTYEYDMTMPGKTVTFLQGGSNTNILDASSLFVYDLKSIPLPGMEFVVHHGGSVGSKVYRVSAVGIDTTVTKNDGIYSNVVYRLQIQGKAEGEDGQYFNRLQADILDGTLVELRYGSTHILDGIRSQQKIKTRPSTAINFDESDEITYRSISFANNDNFGNPLDDDSIIVTFDQPYKIIEVPIDIDNLTGGKGSAIGDTKIAVRKTLQESTKLIDTQITRLTRDIRGKQPPAAYESPNAYAIIEANIEFIQEETIAYINATYPTLVYDEAKCYRDTGLIVDSVARDLLFSGDANTIYAALEYYRGAQSYIPQNQLAETVDALEYARDLVTDFIIPQAGGYTPLNSNGVTQTTGLTASEVGVGTKVDTLMGYVTDALQNGYTVLPVPADGSYQGGMLFTWGGKTHQIIKFEDDNTLIDPVDIVTDGRKYKIETLGNTDWNAVAGTSGETYAQGDIIVPQAASVAGTTGQVSDQGAAIITLNSFPTSNITGQFELGISEALPNVETNLFAALQEDTTAEITIAISLCRATGHDFTQIGSGGFNDSNYPNVLLGPPVGSLAASYADSEDAESGQVWERRKGRVFWMSTDQYGFFRVGKYFNVDQAQGSISFSGELTITNAEGLGFKKGVEVDEFSIDDNMADESENAVPTEYAVVNYINKRLGRDKNDNAVSGAIPPGFLPLTGSAEMQNDLRMGNNKIQNVATPGNGSDAANKSYVDDRVLEFDSYEALRNVSVNRPEKGDLALYTGVKKLLTEVPSDSAGSQTFVIDDLITDTSGNKSAKIVDIVQTTDAIVGENEPGNNIWIIFYELQGVSADFLLTDNIIKGVTSKSTVSASILRGPFEEIGHARESANSVIEMTFTRTKEVFDGALTDPIAEIEFGIKNNTIVNADVFTGAAIQQSKLLMERAKPRSSSAGLFGSNDDVGQGNRGLASFDADSLTHEIECTLSTGITVDAGSYIYQGTNVGTVVTSISNNTKLTLRTSDPFVVNGVTIIESADFTNGVEGAKTALGATITNIDESGYIGLKDRSVGYDKLTTIDSENLLGRASTGTGDIESVTFESVIDQGFGLQDTDFVDSENTVLAGQILTFNTNVTLANGVSLVQDQGSGIIVEGTVQGAVISEKKVYVINVVRQGTSTAAAFNATASIVDGGGTGVGTPTGISPANQNFSGRSLVQLEDGVYATTQISTGSASNSIARRNDTGGLQANKFIVGGTSTNVVLSESGGTLTFSTPEGGTILTATGNSNPTLEIPGNIDQGATNVTQSDLQDGSSFNNEPFLSTNWLYAPFIEAPGEGGANSTGIGIGAGGGLANSAADRILLVTGGAERLRTQDSGTFITGTLSSTGNFTVGVNKMVVNATNGNTSVAGTFGATGAISSSSGISGTSGTFTQNVTISGNLSANGDVTLGNAAADEIAFSGSVVSDIVPSGTRNLGSSSSTWSTVYATTFSGTATTARYADLAENYLADAEYEPGTVVVLGGNEEVTVTNAKGDRRVAGVVSTEPAHLMNSTLEGDHVVAVALTGRVPCKVLGRVNKGDLLVTSAIEGYAVVNNDPKIGTVIGKAVTDKLDDSKGIVEVLVGRV